MIEEIGVQHDKDLPSIPEQCPCDDCVAQVEAGHIATMNEVWPYRLPYTLKSHSATKGSDGSFPPCTTCGGRLGDGHGYVEVSFHIYAPLVPSDTIPFHHVKRALIHNACVITMLDQHSMGLSYPVTGRVSRYRRQLEKFMRTESAFPRQLAELVNYSMPPVATNHNDEGTDAPDDIDFDTIDV